MRKTLSIILAIVFVFFIFQGLRTFHRNLLPKNQFRVLIVYNPALYQYQPGVLQAYESLLAEEGVPYKSVSFSSILSRDFDDLLKSNPVIIIPDVVAQTLPGDVDLWLKNYLVNGGNVLIVYDGGTKNRKGRYLEKAIFSDLLGFNYGTYERLREKAYTKGFIKFKDAESADFFEIPKGVLDKDNFICGYLYGKLEFPIARIDMPEEASDKEIYAYAVTGEGEEYPALISTRFGAGKLFYVNLPLGYLKAYVDELPLREVLRTFLFKIIKVPHLVNTPGGKGGLIINWHIDSNPDWLSIPYMETHGFFRKDIENSFHVTAGDFLDEPGDGMGFDAAGEGEPLIKSLSEYGVFGSHGGWAHNWFAKNLAEGKFGPQEEEEYIKKNNDSLQNILGYKIIEYSAPAGVHPQPVTTEILERLGFIAYYYTGDMGSAPNRTFVNGRMVSDKVIAFPVMPYRTAASLYEMKMNGVLSKEAEDWLRGVVDYTIKNRTVRLIYSHPYNVPDYAKAFSNFLDYAEKEQGEGRIRIKSMSYFAQFLLRFLKTQYAFNLKDGGLEVNLNNGEGLDAITLAIPKDRYKENAKTDFAQEEDEDYYYFTYNGNTREQTLYFSLR